MPPPGADSPLTRAALALDTARVELNDAIDDAKNQPVMKERLVAARRSIDTTVGLLAWIEIDAGAARRAQQCSTSHAPAVARGTAA